MAAYDITQLKSLEHDTADGSYNSLVKIDDTHFILAYTGPGDDGFIKTFYIGTPVSDESNFFQFF